MRKPEISEDISEEINDVITVEGVEFTREQVESQFMLDDKGEEIANKIASSLYFTKYYRDNYCTSIEDNAKIVSALFSDGSPSKINENRREAIRIIADKGSDSEWFYHEEAYPAARDFIREFYDQCEEKEWTAGLNDEDEAIEELASLIQGAAEDKDDSKPLDMLSSTDRAEIGFIYMPNRKGLYQSEWCIENHKNYSDWENISITPAFLEILARLGLTLTGYRKHSRNKNEQYEPGYRPAKKRAVPLVTYDELKDMVENSCSSYFHIGIYAQVPVESLLNLNFEKPIVLEKYSICSFSESGTFYEITKKAPLIIRPEDGVWHSFGKSGPSDWCGLVNSYFHSNIKS